MKRLGLLRKPRQGVERLGIAREPQADYERRSDGGSGGGGSGVTEVATNAVKPVSIRETEATR
jgi:hypothetical protein